MGDESNSFDFMRGVRCDTSCGLGICSSISIDGNWFGHLDCNFVNFHLFHSWVQSVVLFVVLLVGFSSL